MSNKSKIISYKFQNFCLSLHNLMCVEDSFVITDVI
jgi:hypothetical protein